MNDKSKTTDIQLYTYKRGLKEWFIARKLKRQYKGFWR